MTNGEASYCYLVAQSEDCCCSVRHRSLYCYTFYVTLPNTVEGDVTFVQQMSKHVLIGIDRMNFAEIYRQPLEKFRQFQIEVEKTPATSFETCSCYTAIGSVHVYYHTFINTVRIGMRYPFLLGSSSTAPISTRFQTCCFRVEPIAVA